MKAPILMIAVVILLDGCVTTNETLKVCSSSDKRDCKTFPSQKAYDQYAEKESARAIKAAKALPIDYRDIAFAVFKALIGDPKPTNGFLPVYFVSLLGRDPDDHLSDRFRDAGINIRPGSEFPPSKFEHEGKSIVIAGGNNVHIWVSNIEPIGNDRYKSSAGYYCGTLCASALDFVVIANRNEITVESSEMKWISECAPNKRMQPTHQPVIKLAYANLPPVWRAADAWR